MKNKIILKSVLPLSITIILFVFVVVFGISGINKIRSSIALSDKDQNILTQKLNLLQTFSQSTLAGVNAVSFALPDQDPTLTVLSQLRVLAAANGLLISRFASTEVKSDNSLLSEASISFDLQGPMPQITSFLTGTNGITPLIVLDKVSLSQKDSSLLASVQVRSFWSPLPQNISSLTQPITDLTDTEKATLAKVTSLTQPVSSEVSSGQTATTSGESINPNPFGQ